MATREEAWQPDPDLSILPVPRAGVPGPYSGTVATPPPLPPLPVPAETPERAEFGELGKQLIREGRWPPVTLDERRTAAALLALDERTADQERQLVELAPLATERP